MIRILIVDDQALARDGLELIVGAQENYDVIGTASDGAQALEQVKALSPDLVLMDLKMPLMNGVQATRRIREQFPDVVVLVLTTYDDDEWVLDAIRAGAAGYLLKDSPREKILEAIAKVANGETIVSDEITNKLYQFIQRGKPANSTIARDLTDREREILSLLANGLSNADIAERIHLAEGTVRNYVSSIFTKLEVTDRAQATALAWRHHLVNDDG